MSTYSDAGVDIAKGNTFVSQLKPIVQATHIPGVLGNIGGFGGMFELPSGYQQPVLVSATDGVGTKLRLAHQSEHHFNIGIDLVAMCVNDLVVCGAKPLFFLDYYATGELELDVATEVVKGIGDGCQQAGCALIGGETAEMPGHYAKGDYDLAGFCVGIVEKNQIIDGAQVQASDVLIGLNSSGPHANGFSLIRKIISDNAIELDPHLEQQLLAPTKIYVKSLLALTNTLPVHAMAHITGGGITENLPRVLPDHTKATIDLSAFALPDIFKWLQDHAKCEQSELLRTFNCGIGMIVCVPEHAATQALAFLTQQGEQAQVIGVIEPCTEKQAYVDYA